MLISSKQWSGATGVSNAKPNNGNARVQVHVDHYYFWKEISLPMTSFYLLLQIALFYLSALDLNASNLYLQEYLQMNLNVLGDSLVMVPTSHIVFS